MAKYSYDDLDSLMSLMAGDEKHSPAALSTLDILWVLYDRVLEFSPDAPADRGRDRFMLSKGHGPQAYYAVLAAKGVIEPETLATFRSFDSPLGSHPDRTLIPGVEIGSGSLGHGLPIAVGATLALDLQRSTARVFCLVGDGELDEGSNHEAISFAGRVRLARLTTIVVDNGSSTHGWPGGIARRFEGEGWSSETVAGGDHDEIEDALRVAHGGRPHAVVVEVAA
jgi:transketolase